LYINQLPQDYTPLFKTRSSETCQLSCCPQHSTMGFLDNKYVNKFISGGAPPAPFREALTAQEISPPLPVGWIQKWDKASQRWYYLEQSTGLRQWEPPLAQPPQTHSGPYPDDTASMMSGTTANTVTPLTARNTRAASDHRAIMSHSHKYMNMPTAAERAEYWRKEGERQAKEGDKTP
jgi:hypothetical protein